MKLIPLTNSIKPAFVDDEDYDKVKIYSFNLSANGYPRTNLVTKTMCLHNFILGPSPPGMTPDHKNRNKLDNRRENLKFSTGAEQKKNRGILKSNTSGVTNVRFNKATGNYVVRVRKGGKRVHLGYFPTLERAKAVLASWESSS